jgi:pimeloyl-ACP methyl ester carboxylesterase
MTVATTYRDVPTRTVEIDGASFAYRRLGPNGGTPVIFLNHLGAVLDNWDPRVVDGIAARHQVVTFDNRGIGASKGRTPPSVAGLRWPYPAYSGRGVSQRTPPLAWTS